MLSQNISWKLEKHNYDRVADFEAVPRATILRHLIKKRANEACNKLDR